MATLVIVPKGILDICHRVLVTARISTSSKLLASQPVRLRPSQLPILLLLCQLPWLRLWQQLCQLPILLLLCQLPWLRLWQQLCQLPILLLLCQLP
jgi:hypothetical protein